MTSLLKAIGVWHLGGYFEDLDEARKTGNRNMYEGASILREIYPGMTKEEARAVAQAWRDTFNETLPPEDRAEKAVAA